MIFWMSCLRLAHIALVLVKYALASAIGEWVPRWLRLGRLWPLSAMPGPERLRRLFEDLGGTFIKFGQMLALQPDILSLEYCNALFNLLDRVAPFGFDQVERTFVEETGRKPAEIFEWFDPHPIATASIGQVHVAFLNGRKLAVKVQRPDVRTEFAGDIRLMAAAIRLIRKLHLRRLYWMIEPMSEFVAWTREEMDYRHEARYMHELRRNAADNANEEVPKVYWDFTTSRTLVADFLEGATVLSYLRALENGEAEATGKARGIDFDPNAVASNIINNFLGDVFRHGMFHADLHPANLMILPGNVVGYVDFGITGTISRYSRQNLISLTLAYTRGDLDGMCEAFFSVSAMDAHSNVEAFREGLRRAAGNWYESEGRERRLRKNFTLVMLDMLRLSRATSIWPERDVIKYIRSAIAIDGLITRFAPEFNVGRHLEAVCDRYLKWQVRQNVFTYETLAGWSGAGSRMARDGALRAASLLEKLADGSLPVTAEIDSGRDGDYVVLRRRAVSLGAIVFAVAAIMPLTGAKPQFGVNLFTAETLVAGCAAMMILQTIRTLTREG